MNVQYLSGGLGKDAVVRGSDDKPVVSFSVATKEYLGRNTDGTPKYSETEWHDVVCFSGAGKKARDLDLRKGDRVFVSGVTATNKWTNRDGNEMRRKEVHVTGYDNIILEYVPEK